MKEVLSDTLGILAILGVCAIPVLLGVVILKMLKTPLGRKLFSVDGMQVNLKNEYRSYARVVLVIVFVPCVLWLIVTIVRSNITTIFPASPWAYAMEYDTESQYVVIDREPHDCEFFKAPIGSKNCHFHRTVTTQPGDESVNHKTLVYVHCTHTRGRQKRYDVIGSTFEGTQQVMGFTSRYRLIVVWAPTRASPQRTSLLHPSSCAQSFHAGVSIALAESVLDHHQLRPLPSHRVRVCGPRFCAEGET